jgi:hypothetical protein
MSASINFGMNLTSFGFVEFCGHIIGAHPVNAHPLKPAVGPFFLRPVPGGQQLHYQIEQHFRNAPF